MINYLKNVSWKGWFFWDQNVLSIEIRHSFQHYNNIFFFWKSNSFFLSNISSKKHWACRLEPTPYFYQRCTCSYVKLIMNRKTLILQSYALCFCLFSRSDNWYKVALLNAKITSTLTLYTGIHVPNILPFSENRYIVKWIEKIS